MDTWIRADFELVASFDARQWAEWLQTGLVQWDNVRQNWLAFGPLRDRFTLRDDPEPQLAEMFEAMSENGQRLLLEAIELNFSEVKTNESGYSLFDSLMRVVSLINRFEPVPAMVTRVLDDQAFLPAAGENVAQHLFARCIIVVRLFPDHPDAPALMSRLEASPRFKPEYRARA